MGKFTLKKNNLKNMFVKKVKKTRKAYEKFKNELYFHNKKLCKNPVKKLPIKYQFKADISEICYLKPEDRPKKWHKYTLDENFNDDRFVVYFNKYSCMVAFRGTYIKNKTDLHMDSYIVFNQMRKNKYFKKAEESLEEILKAYPKHAIHLTGHSLGGSISLFLLNSFYSKIKSSTLFNPGISVVPYKSDIIQQYAKNPKNHFVIQLGDPVSNGILKYDPKHLICFLKEKHSKIIDNHLLKNFTSNTMKQYLKKI